MSDINKVNYQTLGNMNIDFKEVLARKAARILWGEGFNLYSESNKELNTFLNIFKEESKAYNIFYAMEKILSKYGRAILTIDKTKGNKFFLTIINPNMTSKIGRVFVSEVSAVLWKKIWHNDKMYWIKEEWDTMKVSRQVFTEDQNTEMTVMGFNASVPKDLQVEEVWHHNIGVLPVIEFANLPDYNFDLFYQGWNPDDKAASELIHSINHTINQFNKELVLNRTRIFGSLSPEKLMILKTNANQDTGWILNDLVVQTELRGKDGSNLPISILQGDPKLNVYITAIQEMTEMYFNLSGYEWAGGETATADTATGAMLSKGRDIETNKEKRAQRTRDIIRLIDRLAVAGGFYSNVNELQQDRPYVFEIRENIVIDTLKQVEITEKQLNNGLVSRESAIANLNGISKLEAQQAKEEIDKELQEDGEVLGEQGREQPEEQGDNNVATQENTDK